MKCLRQIQWPLEREICTEERKAKEVETVCNIHDIIPHNDTELNLED